MTGRWTGTSQRRGAGLLATKLGRDLRASWPRLLLMVVAIAVSLTAFSTVLYAWSAIDRETTRAYLSTEPASATIRFAPPIDTAAMAAVVAETRTRPQVIEATGRTQFATDVVVGGQDRALQLQVLAAAPDDPMRMASFETRPGGWPPAPGEILLGSDSLALLDVDIGDTITIETPGATSVRLRVAGTVYDPSLSPAAQEQVGRGYLSTALLAALGQAEVFDQLKIQVAGDVPSSGTGDDSGEPEPAAPTQERESIVATATEVARWLQREHGLAVQEVQVPEPYTHPHQGQAEALLSAMLVGAGAALLLSTILVASLLAGLFAQQIPQIGIMKAIGGRSGRIGRHYLAMTLTVAGVATLVALPPGILLGRAFAPNVFGYLGIEAASVAPVWWTYLVVFAAGLLLPVLMALLPLLRASRTTVRAAIDHSGVSSGLGRTVGVPSLLGRVMAALGRVRGFDSGPSRGLLMALRNTLRRPARFLLSVGLLASAGMMFVAGVSARDGMQAVGDESSDQLRWDVTAQLASPAPVAELAPVLAQLPDVDRVEGWTVTSAGVSGPGELPVSRTYPDQGHGRFAVTAVPAGTTMFSPPRLTDGRWLAPQETGAIVLNQVALATADIDARAGGTVELSIGGASTTWRVVGIVQERGATSRGYVTSAGLAAVTGQPPMANLLRIATGGHDEQTRTAVARAVDQALTSAGIEVRSAESVNRMEAVTAGHLEPILVILLVTALPMAAIGCLGLASTMGASVLERIREFGVMHAIGALPRTVRRIVVAEGVLVALASCVVAVLPALGLTAVMGAVLGNTFMYTPLPFRFSLLAAGIWVVLIVLGAMLATDASAARASRVTVREALAHL